MGPDADVHALGQVGVARGGRVFQAGRDLHVHGDPAVPEPYPAHPVSVALPHGWAARSVRGRGVLLDRLVDAAGQVVVLHGVGGCGKTTVALELARRTGPRVWWVDGSSAASLAQGFGAVALQAGAGETEARSAWGGLGSMPDLLWRALRGMAQRWLLVVDNADDVGLLADAQGVVVDGHGWLRTPGPGGTLVVTSRDGRAEAWGGSARLVAVEPLAGSDAAAVLADLAPAAGGRADAEALARRLGGLPLALRLAGSYLAATNRVPALSGVAEPRTFAEYLTAWETRFADIVTRGLDQPVPVERRALHRTWELSLDLLAARGLPVARPLMRLLSVLDGARIPGWLLHPAVLADSGLFGTASAADLAHAVAGLAGVGLVDRVGPGWDALTVHPVVREANRHQADAIAAMGEYLWLAVRLVEHAVAGMTHDDPGHWPRWRSLVPHCTHLIDRFAPLWTDERALVVARIAHRVGDACHAAGLHLDADRFYGATATLRWRVLGAEHPDTLAARHCVALMLRDRGDLSSAAAELRRVLDLREAVLGVEEPATLATRHELARVLRRQGDLTGAESELRHVLRVRARVLGAAHPATLDSHNNFAFVLRQSGDLADAEREFRVVLRLRREVLGPEHPDTLTTRHNLAGVFWRCGDLVEAEAQYRDIVTVGNRVLGPEHPQVLQSRHRRSCVLRDQGLLDTAEAELRDIVTTCERVLGKDNPDTLLARLDLALVTGHRGDPTAEAQVRDVLAAQLRVLGPLHPDTLTSEYHLAHSTADRRRLDALLTTCRSVLDARHHLIAMLQATRLGGLSTGAP
uniref:tetratricopeptide repeat protein n=1 Tax=Saccharothrix mutabilis TaxID=33921 RepID=UPI0031DA7675